MTTKFRFQFLLTTILGPFTLFLVSCGNLPQPFTGEDQNSKIVESILTNSGVMIAPIIDAPPPANIQLAERIARAARDRDLVAVTRSPNRNAHLLQGFASTHQNEKGEVHIRVSWQLSGPDGIAFSQFVTETLAFAPTADDPWLLYANSDMTPLIDQTADLLASAMLDGRQGQDSSQDTIVTQLNLEAPYHLYVKGVEGAPGDGSQSLADAMNELLTAEGIPIPITVDSNPDKFSYVIAGRVTVTEVDDSAEAISLEWNLSLPDGQILGSVSQENIIPRGSLDGEWGEIAYEAAAAAADGLMTVLLQVEPLGPSLTD